MSPLFAQTGVSYASFQLPTVVEHMLDVACSWVDDDAELQEHLSEDISSNRRLHDVGTV